MYNIAAESAGVAHHLAVKKITEIGVPDITEDGEHVVKLEEPLCIHISDPLHGYNKHVKSPYGLNFDAEYIEKVLHVTAKRNDGTDAVYTYGNRFRDYLQPGHRSLDDHFQLLGDGDLDGWNEPMGYDQLGACVTKLTHNPKTRRAVMSTWIPWKDHGCDEPPCIMVVDLKVCKDALTLVAYIRSNDILMAWGENVVGLTAILVNTAKNLNMRVGYIETISRDAHVYYKRDQNYLRDMGIMYDE